MTKNQVLLFSDSPDRYEIYLKLFEKSHIVFLEQTNVGYLIFHHGKSCQPQAKSKTRPFFRIKPAVFDDLGVN